MKNIPLSIKEKFVCYTGSKIMNTAAYIFQSLTNQVVSAMAGTAYDADRIINITIQPELLFKLVEILGQEPEKFTGGLHMQMKENMVASITSTYMAEMAKPEADRDLELLQSIGWFNQKMQERETSIDDWRASNITQGRNFFVS